MRGYLRNFFYRAVFPKLCPGSQENNTGPQKILNWARVKHKAYISLGHLNSYRLQL